MAAKTGHSEGTIFLVVDMLNGGPGFFLDIVGYFWGKIALTVLGPLWIRSKAELA